MEKLSKAERYLRQAEECIALAKAATSNKLRARHYATAERYRRLAEAEPTVNNQDAARIPATFHSLLLLPGKDDAPAQANSWRPYRPCGSPPKTPFARIEMLTVERP